MAQHLNPGTSWVGARLRIRNLEQFFETTVRAHVTSHNDKI